MAGDAWVLTEDEVADREPGGRDVLFTLGNGAFEVNGASPLATRGRGWTFIGGVYGEGPPTLHFFPPVGHDSRDSERYPSDTDCFKHTTPGLVVAPNVFALRLRLNGRRAQEPVACARALDLQRGILRAECEIQTPDGALALTSTRLVSLADLHLAAERIEIRAGTDVTVEIAPELDASRRNVHGYDLWEERAADALGEGVLGWRGVTTERGMRVAVCLACTGGGQAIEPELSGEAVRAPRRARIAAGGRLVVDRFVGVASAVLDADPAGASRESCVRAARSGFEACLAAHESAWRRFWEENDIRIEGPEEDQRAIRYAVFQVRCAVPPSDAYGIGAKFLSGEGYRGCVFWDTDVFILPYLIKTQPDAARRHVAYRHRTLPACRAIAAGQGLQGARYAWESLPDGSEALGPWVIFASTQVHVVADVAWGVADYYRWTGDRAFIEGPGGEVLAETARFWMSRMTKTDRGYEIRRVCGPDENHPRVNNSVYTNLLAAENLRLAARFGTDAPEQERRAWERAAGRLVVHAPGADGVVEQCDGFFSVPPLPDGRRMSEPGMEAYQVLKQADVINLPILFPGLYTDEQVAANYDYYEPRTSHGSSLSAGAHAIVAARIGRTAEAYRMFRQTAFMDLANRHGNTAEGLHAACTALVPRVVMEGFAGLRLREEGPSVSARLPDPWESVEFGFRFHGKRNRCRVTSGGEETICPS